MNQLIAFQYLIIIFALISPYLGYNVPILLRKCRYFKSSSILFSQDESNDKIKSSNMREWEERKVDKGLTHIKYNKYAPSADEATNMTSNEFRETIYKRMKEAERERRVRNGVVGNAASQEYLDSLSRKPSPKEEETL